jgi:hypothetical protein
MAWWQVERGEQREFALDFDGRAEAFGIGAVGGASGAGLAEFFF